MTFRLDWAMAPERLEGSVFAHRAAALGRGAAGLTEQGYVVAPSLEPAARAFGLDPRPGPEAVDTPIGLPRIALFCGPAVGYPYYAFYAHCLLSLGLAYRPVDATSIAAGALAEADLLIMPGGFATWGLDRAEAATGTDAAIRAFLARGGAYIGSCGGAFYLSEGRPGWLGLIDAKPTYTHEYLQTGAGILNVRLTDPALRGALPERVELAYYHGPAYPAGDRRARTLATFEGFAMPSRLFIDNPLARESFARDLAGAPAILAADTSAARAIAFSPHPEMGDFVRKGIALDGYVRRYLPIRGTKAMDETLRFYGTEDCLSFRVVLNAMIRLGLFAPGGPRVERRIADMAGLAALRNSLGEVATALSGALDAAGSLADETAGVADLVGREIERRRAEWDEVLAAWDRATAATGLDAELVAALVPALRDAVPALEAAADAPLAHRLVLAELPVRLAAAALRIVRCDHLLEA